MAQDKTIVGFESKIKIIGPNKTIESMARIDTGARTCSIDMKLAAELNLGPIIETRFVNSASGHSVRPIMKAKFKIQDRIIETDVTIANRSHLKYPVLIGRNLLNKDFIIDPSVDKKGEE